MLRDIFNQVRRAFSICYLCRLPIDNNQPICLRCQSYFEKNTHACSRCAMPITAPPGTLCGQCQTTKSYVDKTYAFWRYQPPLTGLIHDFKYHNHLFLAPFLAQCMLKYMPQPLLNIDYLIPMPIHPKRLKTRGYNQTSLLAKILCEQTGITLNQTLCQRVIFHGPQVLLNQQSRLKNTKNAFHAKSVNQHHLMIIDDLVTTGATANSLAKELKRQGAKQVDLWCIARQY